MIPRAVAMALVLMTALLLGTVAMPAISSGVWRPDLVVLTVVAFALADGPGTGGRYGFAAGLTVDVLSTGSQLVGTGALVLLLVGYASGLARPYLASAGLVGQVALAGVASAASVLGYGILAVMLEVGATTPLALAQSALATAAYNAALSPLVLVPVSALWRRLPATGSVTSRSST